MSSRTMTCSTTLYRPFISQETYEEHSRLDTAFTEYLEQATLRRDKEKASTVQQTAEQHNKHNEALSRMQMLDTAHSSVLCDAAHPGMQFPRVSNISTEDQSSFLEEYRNILLGDLDKLELNKMKVNQVCSSYLIFKMYHDCNYRNCGSNWLGQMRDLSFEYAIYTL